jgi:hypothetical protein
MKYIKLALFKKFTFNRNKDQNNNIKSFFLLFLIKYNNLMNYI